MRNSAIKFLSSSLTETGSESAEVDQELSEKLEAEIFRQSNKLVNNKYRKLSRKVIFALKRKGVRVFLMGVGKGVNKVRTYKFRSCSCNGDFD